MTTPTADTDPPVANLQSPTREVAECEAGLRRVLAYICARRHRRLIAGAVVFLLLFRAIGFVVSIPLTFFVPLIPLGSESLFQTIYGEPVILGLWVFVTELLLPLVVTLIIFKKLRRIYRGY